jgi:hypothetical protein
MVLPQALQNFAPARMGLPQFGQALICCPAGAGLAGGGVEGGTALPQLPQNLTPGRIGLPQFGQVLLLIVSSLSSFRSKIASKAFCVPLQHPGLNRKLIPDHFPGLS